jgi:hypothetical protein
LRIISSSKSSSCRGSSAVQIVDVVASITARALTARPAIVESDPPPCRRGAGGQADVIARQPEPKPSRPEAVRRLLSEALNLHFPDG